MNRRSLFKKLLVTPAAVAVGVKLAPNASGLVVMANEIENYGGIDRSVHDRMWIRPPDWKPKPSHWYFSDIPKL